MVIDGVVQPSSGDSSLKTETAGCDKLQQWEEDETVR